jgi:hypothetical protein
MCENQCFEGIEDNEGIQSQDLICKEYVSNLSAFNSSIFALLADMWK